MYPAQDAGDDADDSVSDGRSTSHHHVPNKAATCATRRATRRPPVEKKWEDDVVCQPPLRTADSEASSARKINDALLWCEDCGRSVRQPCKKHGSLTKIKDRKIPCRAKLTAPHHVGVKLLEYRAGRPHVYGVFAHKIIQKRTMFGPFEAILTDDSDWCDEREYSIKLKIFSKDGTVQCLDSRDDSVCNWLMYVRPASFIEDRNMAIHQHRGAIYYTTTKPIAPNEELRAWYAADYGAVMSMPPLQSVSDMIGLKAGQQEVLVANQTAERAEELDKVDVDADVVLPNLKQEPREPGGRRPLTSQGKKRRSARNKPYQHWHSLRRRASKTKVSGDVDAQFEEAHADLPDEDDSDQQTATDDQTAPKPSKANTPENVVTPGEETRKPPERKKPSMGRRTKNKQKGRPVKCLKVTKKRGRPKLGPRREIHPCDVCNKCFATPTKLKIHLYMHSGERPYRCTFENCVKAFTTRFKLLRHQLIHDSDSATFKCLYCDKSFSRKDHLKNHIKVHDPNKEMLACAKCGKQYVSPLAYKTHLALHRTHEGELDCGVCSQEFEDKASLLNHLKVHAGARSVKDGGERTKKCPSCDRLFFTNKDVQRHMVVHTKEREFMCHLCPQRFGRRDHLIRHIKKSHIKLGASDVLLPEVGALIQVDQPGEQKVLPLPSAEIKVDTPEADKIMQETSMQGITLESVDKYLQDAAPMKAKSVKAKRGKASRQQTVRLVLPPTHADGGRSPDLQHKQTQLLPSATDPMSVWSSEIQGIPVQLQASSTSMPQQIIQGHLLNTQQQVLTQPNSVLLSSLSGLSSPNRALNQLIQSVHMAGGTVTTPVMNVSQVPTSISQVPMPVSQVPVPVSQVSVPVAQGSPAIARMLAIPVAPMATPMFQMSTPVGQMAAPLMQMAAPAVASSSSSSTVGHLVSGIVNTDAIDVQVSSCEQKDVVGIQSLVQQQTTFDCGNLLDRSAVMQNAAPLPTNVLHVPALPTIQDSVDNTATHPVPTMLQKTAPNIIRRSHSMQSQPVDVSSRPPAAAMRRAPPVAVTSQALAGAVSGVTASPTTVNMYTVAMKILDQSEDH